MKVGYIVGLYLDKMLSDLGAAGLKKHLGNLIGGTLASLVVETLVKKGTAKAVAALGTKVGALAGPAGAVIGVIAGAS
ncbi:MULTISPECIES: hypothetical protein [Eubacteriales]|uniref:hypothetical protein n=1 Tax=Eubacteriales TaxID=186802 RepID=UPI001030BDDD|nr:MULTISPECIES: hypothetical protein [Eubacteriales]